MKRKLHVQMQVRHRCKCRQCESRYMYGVYSDKDADACTGGSADSRVDEEEVVVQV